MSEKRPDNEEVYAAGQEQSKNSIVLFEQLPAVAQRALGLEYVERLNAKLQQIVDYFKPQYPNLKITDIRVTVPALGPGVKVGRADIYNAAGYSRSRFGLKIEGVAEIAGIMASSPISFPVVVERKDTPPTN